MQNDKYQPILLGHYTEGGFAVTGMAVLRVGTTREFKLPADTIVAVSKAMLKYGDVTRVISSSGNPEKVIG